MEEWDGVSNGRMEWSIEWKNGMEWSIEWNGIEYRMDRLNGIESNGIEVIEWKIVGMEETYNETRLRFIADAGASSGESRRVEEGRVCACV